jgi:hypothetical protein
MRKISYKELKIGVSYYERRIESIEEPLSLDSTITYRYGSWLGLLWVYRNKDTHICTAKTFIGWVRAEYRAEEQRRDARGK